MSKMSKIFESHLKHKHSAIVDDASEADKYMEKRSLEEDDIFELPK